MGRKRHGAEQIIAKLREAEVELARGKAAGELPEAWDHRADLLQVAAGVRGLRVD